MSLLSIFNISGSALTAQSLRLNVTASNLANAETVSSSIDRTYRARHPIFQALLDPMDENNPGSGVKVQAIVESKEQLRMRYEPENPLANAEGYIFMPNVNVVEEMANMISASRSYQNNVEVFNTSKQLLMQTLRMGQ
ncbi:MAG: flagellar basal body rod protein FlgC [Pseudomonadota bacterium]